MAYQGLFIDRTSALRPAGIPLTKVGENIKDCFVHEVSELEAKPFVCKTGPLDYSLPPWKTQIYNGFFTGVRECLQPEADWGFTDVLKREFQDTVYDSLWKKRLGRVPDPVPMLPKGMVPEKVCFGKPTPKDISAGELVNPPKSYLDVMEESNVGHDMYKRTHNDYNPGEQIERNYIDPFKRHLVWGKTTHSDPQGGCIKKVLDDNLDEKILVSKILADHRKRTKFLVGKVLEPNQNIQRVPEDHAFGKLNKREIFGAGELMKDCDPHLDKIDLFEEMSSLNTLRQQIAKRQPPFPHRDLNDAFHHIDPRNTGCLHLDQVYEILADFHVFPDRALFEAVLKRLKYLTEGDFVDYERMADVLNVNVMFPDVSKIKDCPQKMLNFETTTQAAYKYHCSPHLFKNDKFPKAGVTKNPSISVNSIVSPSIYTTYGLDPKDFFVSRTPEYLKTLFRNVTGCDISEDNFRKSWESAKDRNGCVCVHSFWCALKELSSDSNGSSNSN